MKRLISRSWRWALLLTLLAGSVQADFDPKGRRRGGKAPAAGKPKPSAPRTPGTTKPSAKPPVNSQPTVETPAAKTAPEGPGDAVLIQRYKSIVLSQPGAQFPLQRLAELVRKRDGHLDQLVAELEAQAAKAGPDQYAALVALAGIYVQSGQPDRAVATYDQAVALVPGRAVALLALARLQQDRGQLPAARQLFERAVPLLTDDAEREQALRTLLKLALDTDDLPAARKVHEQLVQRAKGSFFVQSELGNELLARNKLEAAEAEYRRVVKLAHGDNRALAPALRDLGQALHRQRKTEEAITTLQQALRLTSDSSGLRRELLDLMVEVYRSADRLPQMISLLEQESAADFARLRLLGSLYEERGQLPQALATYRRALKLNSKDLEIRLRTVRLLQLQGELDAAIEEYKQLIAAAPHNPDFVFQLVDALLQQGERAQAIAELKKLETRSAGDEQIQTSLVDFYERVGEKERSLKLLESLARNTTADAEHLIELGDRYYQEGNLPLAERTWKRLLVGEPNRALALSKLGDVYLDHNMPEQALQALEEAVQLAPNETRYKRALALALERTGASAAKSTRLERYERALHLWEKLLTTGKSDPNLAREARQHMVTLWGLAGTLEARIAPLERNLKAQPPDLESGRLLAQMYERLKRPEQAERVLRVVAAAAPGDAQTLLHLERVLVAQRKLQEAVAVLKKLLQVDPSRAREFYQRMANYSVELYLDEDAIAYAERAVELSPEDAMGHKNLAEMYARRQDAPRAIAEYRRAIAQNDRLFPAYFDLAELLLSRQETAEADQLLRRVMRSAVDEELVARAARLSLQIHINQGTVEELEKELLPIALAQPDKPIYRRLLIELYSALTTPLVQSIENATAQDAQKVRAARDTLARLGQRAVKPLLDVLADSHSNQQHLAIELLTHLHNEHASQALLVYAGGDAPVELRVRAMIAACAPGHSGLLGILRAKLSDQGQVRVDEGDPVSLAAAWGLTQIQSDTSDGVLLELLPGDSPTAQVLAAVALGQRRVLRAKPALLRMLDSNEYSPLARAAAMFALGELGAKEATDALVQGAQHLDTRVQAVALVALARLDPTRAQKLVAEGFTSPRPGSEAAVLGAAGLIGGAKYQPGSPPLAVPEGRVDAERVLQATVPALPGPSERALAIVKLEGELTSAIRGLVQRTPEQTREVARALVARAGKPALGRLSAELQLAEPKVRAEAEAALTRIAQQAVAPFAALTSHPLPAVRQAALQFLSYQDQAVARDAVVLALQDPQPEIRRMLLGALAQRPFDAALEPTVRMLQQTEDWSMRVAALDTLAQFAPATAQTPAGRAALASIVELAKNDPIPFVREAALRALVALDPQTARAALQHAANKDAEERVRKLASHALSTL